MRILVVEDNEALAAGLSKVLKGSGYAVDTVSDGVSADAVIATQSYDLVILDLTLPEMDGLDVLRGMRGRHDDTPVLVLTARGGLDDRIRGLDLGADDYLTKPFEVGELEARIRVLIRRKAGLGTSAAAYGPLALDLKSRVLLCNGKPVDMPARELSVLETLMLNQGRVVSKQQIVDSLSAFDEEVSDNAIEQYVSRLRKKLAPVGVSIRMARGLGYYLDQDGTA
ncbi:MAG: response regulator transcription factor [Bauldia sp.]|nr:MAG: response regulator transcription factor [Bauldia sp.]